MISLELTRNEIFQSFSNSLGSWWIEVDTDLKINWTNRKFQKSLEYSKELEGENFIKLLHSLDVKKFHHAAQKSLKSVRVVPFVAKVKDSKRQYRNVKFKVKYSPSNKVYYVVAKEFKRRFDLKLQLEQYSKNLFDVNQSLEKTSFGLMRLQGVLSKDFENFDEQIDALLKFGCDSFGATVGTISNIESYSYTIKHKTGATDDLKDIYNLKNTPCYNVTTKKKVLSCVDTSKDDEASRLALINDIGAKGFITAPLIGKEGIMGTICFYFDKPFELINNEVHFLTILASMVARTVSLKKAENSLIQSNKRLEEKNAELDKFAFTVSHDLKSPLRAVKALVEWIEEDLEEKLEGDIKENFNLLTGRVDKMDKLIHDILNYSRAGNEEVKSEKVNIQDVVKDVLFEHQDHEGKTITVTKEGLDKVVLNKRIFIYQTISNLVSNAIKYSGREDVEIKISAIEIGGLLKIKVEDNGPGIPEKHWGKIFQVFQTVHGENRSDSTGIGLSIVKKIVKAMGGAIAVNKSSIGGSAFEFSLLVSD